MDPPTTLMNNTGVTGPFSSMHEIWQIPTLGHFGLGRVMQPGPAQNHDGDDDDEEANDDNNNNNNNKRRSSGKKRRENGVCSSLAPADEGVCNGMSDSDAKRQKVSGSADDDQNHKGDAEASSGKGAEQKSKPPPEPPKDFIHVRARRGQATDSHSLAERARREKISDRMRILQDLVPGCNKVIGKALVLDEIINYIQSLQRQVEFLSMKLEAVNDRIAPPIERYPSKDFGQQAYDSSGVVYGSQLPREYGRGASPEWLHMQIGGGFERQT